MTMNDANKTRRTRKNNDLSKCAETKKRHARAMKYVKCEIGMSKSSSLKDELSQYNHSPRRMPRLLSL
jgi:hypothetical protein